MRDYLKQIVSVCVVAGLLAACSSSGGNTGEPNDSILKAGMLETGKAYTMKIDSLGDIDWYAISVPGQGYVKISTKKVPDNLVLEVRFAEKQAWKQKKQKWLTGWQNIPETVTVPEADTLYFAIIDDYHDQASNKKIRFKAEFIKEFDKYEPNDDPDNATLVSSGEVMKTSFFPKTDFDWFKIKVKKPGYLMIKARSVPEGIEIDARYAKKESAFSKAEYIKGWQRLPAGIQIVEPGVYYFSLIDSYNDAMAREKAEWKVEYIAEIDSTEPNNSVREAYKWAIGDTVKTAIFPLGDNDYFTLTPDSPVTVRLASQAPENIGIDVHLHIKEGFKVHPVGDWQSLPAQFKLKGGQQYYFQIIDDYNDAYSKKPVILSIASIKSHK